MATLFQISILFSWAILSSSSWTYDDQEAWRSSGDCGGSRQSPIDIVTKDTRVDVDLDGTDTRFKIGLDFGENIPNLNYKNDGTTLKMEYTDGLNSNITLSGGKLLYDDYTFAQFHYHWGNATHGGSEHTVDGKRYPAEIHFVFVSKSHTSLNAVGDATVLGFFIDIADDDNFEHGGNWDKLFTTIQSENLQNNGASTLYFDAKLALSDLIPVYWLNPMRRFFRYEGSLTTPNCNEAITWNVFQDPIYISQDQYDKFLLTNFGSGAQMVNNYRYVQSLNNRIVYRSSQASIETKSTGWSYAEQDKWGDYSANCNGRRQSPINIETDKTIHDASLDTGFSFADAFGVPIAYLELINLGYTWQMTDVNMPTSLNVIQQGPKLPVGITDYTFFQFHYHWGTEEQPGSEHTIDGKRYPAEVHFVFKSKSTPLANANSLAVLGFMIDIYDDNDNFEHGGQFGNILEAITTLTHKDDVKNYLNDIALADLLPLYNPEIMGNFYRYDGSLTTPTCNEVVNWYVFGTPLYVSREQYKNFLAGVDANNNVVVNTYREVQPLNERIVYRSAKASHSNIAQLSATTLLLVAIASLLRN